MDIGLVKKNAHNCYQSLPYACHFGRHSILSKNGELMQVIRVRQGSRGQVAREDGEAGSNPESLREALRLAILESLPSRKFAIWLNTLHYEDYCSPLVGERELGGSGSDRTNSVRGHSQASPSPDRTSLRSSSPTLPQGESNNGDKKNNAQRTYSSELYITVLYEGQKGALRPQTFLRSLWPAAENDYRLRYLAEAEEKLNEAVGNILESLAPYGAERLDISLVSSFAKASEDRAGYPPPHPHGVTPGSSLRSSGGSKPVNHDDSQLSKEKPLAYSYPAMFFSRLLNLEDDFRPLSFADLSESMASDNVNFGFNTFDMEGAGGKKFGAVLTLKEYKDVPEKAVNKLLSLPVNMQVTESITFTSKKAATESFEEQKYLTGLLEDENIQEITGISDLFGSGTGNPADYGEHQVNIMVYAESEGKLAQSMDKVLEVIAALGLVAMREDIRLEDCFWAQMPGNFAFLYRTQPVNTLRTCGFTALPPVPRGDAESALITLTTLYNTAYHFGLDSGDSPHSLILTGEETADGSALAKLLADTFAERKGRAVVINLNNQAESDAKETVTTGMIDPLNLADTPDNRKFCAMWLAALVSSYGAEILPEDMDMLASSVSVYYDHRAEGRSLAEFADYLEQNGLGRLAGGVKRYVLAGVGAAHNLDFSGRINELSLAVSGGLPEEAVIPALIYILHVINLRAQEEKSLVVMEGAEKLLENPGFCAFLSDWLESFEEKGGAAVFTAARFGERAKLPAALIGNWFIMPGARVGEHLRQEAGLTAQDQRSIADMRDSKGRVFIKNALGGAVCQSPVTSH